MGRQRPLDDYRSDAVTEEFGGGEKARGAGADDENLDIGARGVRPSGFQRHSESPESFGNSRG